MASAFVEENLIPGPCRTQFSQEDHPETADRDQAIRGVFGIPRGVSLPRVSEGSLFDYYRHLTGRLSLPFTAEIYQDDCPGEDRHHTVMVVGLLAPTRHRKSLSSGLMCLARKGGVVLEVPVAELEVREEGENQRLVEDYWYWFWNWR